MYGFSYCVMITTTYMITFQWHAMCIVIGMNTNKPKETEMATYAYQCTECGHVYEIPDPDSLTVCPVCGTPENGRRCYPVDYVG